LKSLLVNKVSAYINGAYRTKLLKRNLIPSQPHSRQQISHNPWIVNGFLAVQVCLRYDSTNRFFDIWDKKYPSFFVEYPILLKIFSKNRILNPIFAKIFFSSAFFGCY